MNLFELFILAVALSMDAFAASFCSGLVMRRVTVKKMVIVGLYFGVFQAFTPLIGYLAATLFANMIQSYDHWIAFVLLCFLGIKMIIDSFKKGDCISCEEECLEAANMYPLAFATSVDALAAGVSLAFLKVNIIPAVTFIGITTFFISMIGVLIGRIFGMRFKSTAEIAGGIILIIIGLKILLEHLSQS